MTQTVQTVLLRALLLTVTPATAGTLNTLLTDLLRELAASTQTDLDDKMYTLFKRFLELTDSNESGQ